MLISRGYPGKFNDGILSGSSGVDAYLPIGVPAANLVLALDYKNKRYFKNGIADSFSNIQTFTRSGVTWTWKLVNGNLELVEIADGVPPFSVDPATGHKIGLDTFPAITRRNPRYMPTAADVTTAGATVSDLALNVLGNFAGLKINSTGSLADKVITTVTDNTALTGGTRYSFDILLRDDNESATVRFGLRGATSVTDTLIEYTFATLAVTNPVVAGGVFSSLVATMLVDGTHRITGDFIPIATESFGLLLQPQTITAGAGFTLAAWFLAYITTQQRRTPPPVLGAEGATYTTNKAINGGQLIVAGARTLVTITHRICQNSYWDYDVELSDNADSHIRFTNRNNENTTAIFSDSIISEANNLGTIAYGVRTGMAASYIDTLRSFTSYDSVNGARFYEWPTNMAMQPSVNFNVGSSASGSTTLGNVTEGVFIFDIALTRAQLEEMVQRVF